MDLVLTMSHTQDKTASLRFSPDSEAQILRMFRLSGSDPVNPSNVPQSKMSEQNKQQESTAEPQPTSSERVKCREISIQVVSGLRVAGKSWGSKNAPIKVLALHGWLDNSATWDGLAPLLAPYGIEIVAIDFIGHGKSEHLPPQAEPFFINYVTQVFDVAQALGWQSFHLLGHSMGAAVASMVAGLMPGAIESVVLVEALGPLSSNAKAAVVMEEALRDRVKYLKRQPKVWPSVDDCVRKLRANNPDIAEHSAKAIVRRGTINVQGGVSFCHDPRLVGKSPFRLREDDVLGFLERIRCPTLLVWTKGTLALMRKQEKKRKEEQKEADPGIAPKDALSEDESRKDRVPSPLEVMEARMRAVRNLELLLVEGYHHVHIDTPEVIQQQVLKFFVRPKPKL